MMDLACHELSVTTKVSPSPPSPSSSSLLSPHPLPTPHPSMEMREGQKRGQGERRKFCRGGGGTDERKGFLARGESRKSWHFIITVLLSLFFPEMHMRIGKTGDGLTHRGGQGEGTGGDDGDGDGDGDGGGGGGGGDIHGRIDTSFSALSRRVFSFVFLHFLSCDLEKSRGEKGEKRVKKV